MHSIDIINTDDDDDSMMFDPSVPYNDLPNLPVRKDVETTDVLKLCIMASRALGELKGLLESIPDQIIILELLPLQESRSSSEVENIVSSRDRLFMASSVSDVGSDIYTREILRYNRTLMSHSNAIMDEDTIRGICSEICGADVDYRNNPDDIVCLRNMHSVVYTPPSGENVHRLMRNLIEFIYSDDGLDPLVKMAIMHYQFEAIHPFFDGNGRTGRILNIIYLQYNQLIREPVLFLSRYIIDNRKRYYQLIRNVSGFGDWAPWIEFMLEGVYRTSLDTIRLIKSIVKEMDSTKAICLEHGVPSEVSEFVFANPFSTVSMMVDRLSLSRPTATKYVRIMESIGVLESIKEGRCSVYRNQGLLSLFRE